MIPHNRPFMDASDIAAVQKVLKSGWVAEGKVTQEFESRLAATLQRKYAKAVSSGTAALHLALLALGVKKGGEVICSTYACTALLNAVYYTGATSKIADIEGETLGLSAKTIKPYLTKRTKAIIVNHTFGFGNSAEIGKIGRILKPGIPIIEDIAQALGSKSGGRPLGSFGDLTICSFYATKMMTSGYGGAVLTNHKKWADKIRDLTQYDRRPDYKVRYNYSLSDINAALGLSQLKKLNAFVERRRQIAKKYLAALKNSKTCVWTGKKGDSPNFYRFVIATGSPAARLIGYFKKRGIQAISPLEPYQLLHRYLKLPSRHFPVAESIARCAVSIPVYPALSAEEAGKVCDSLKAFRSFRNF